MNNKLIGYRPTWAEVNLSNLKHNFAQVKKIVPRGVKIMVTVKADAYGHGLIPVAKKLVSCGVDYLGVASIDEGIKLREAKIRVPILILGLILKNKVDPLFKYNLAPTICTEEMAVALNKRAKNFAKPLKAHIKIDTGMGRIGVAHKEAARFIAGVAKLKFIEVEGVFTHFALADTDTEFTTFQISLLEQLIKQLIKQGIKIPLVHAANSVGIARYPRGHFNMVRPGLVVYGLYPDATLDIDLKPLLSLRTKIVYIKKVPKGCGISYGHTYLTKKETTIVTLPIGYGDGYPRNLSNIAPVLIGGRRFKISGRVCMDQIMVDVGNAPVLLGDEVVLIGAQGKERITAEELADLAGTIPYEIVCGLGSRIPRLYT